MALPLLMILLRALASAAFVLLALHLYGRFVGPLPTTCQPQLLVVPVPMAPPQTGTGV